MNSRTAKYRTTCGYRGSTSMGENNLGKKRGDVRIVKMMRNVVGEKGVGNLILRTWGW
jgi:hypothetical protein